MTSFIVTGLPGRQAEKRKEITKEKFVTGQKKKKKKFDLDWGTGTA